MADNNAVGERGEAIFLLALTEFVGVGDTPYFRACQQGQKWPATDFYCELQDRVGHSFLVQAKTTRQPIVSGSHVPIDKLTKADMAKLFSSPMPFYLAAVHEPSKLAYIGVPNTCRSIERVPTTFLLSDKVTLDTLKAEVEKHWNRKQLKKFDPSKSKFAF